MLGIPDDNTIQTITKTLYIIAFLPLVALLYAMAKWLFGKVELAIKEAREEQAASSKALQEQLTASFDKMTSKLESVMTIIAAHSVENAVFKERLSTLEAQFRSFVATEAAAREDRHSAMNKQAEAITQLATALKAFPKAINSKEQ